MSPSPESLPFCPPLFSPFSSIAPLSGLLPFWSGFVSVPTSFSSCPFEDIDGSSLFPPQAASPSTSTIEAMLNRSLFIFHPPFLSAYYDGSVGNDYVRELLPAV